MSEVIGRGWEDREEDLTPRYTNNVKTEVGTAASHIKNSSIGNSALGVGESVMRWA